MIKRLLILLAFAGLAACGGSHDLLIDGKDITHSPNLASLRDGLEGDPDHPPYVVNPLAQKAQQELQNEQDQQSQ